MKFQEAKDRLKRLANGRYHRVMFSLAEFSDGTMDTEVWLYIDGKNDKISSDFAPNFDTAFSQLEESLGLAGNEEIPEVAA